MNTGGSSLDGIAADAVDESEHIRTFRECATLSTTFLRDPSNSRAPVSPSTDAPPAPEPYDSFVISTVTNSSDPPAPA